MPTVRAKLADLAGERDWAVIDSLIKVRLLSFAFVASPVVSLIPYAMTNVKEYGLLSFGIGTVSIIASLLFFSRLRSTAEPTRLIKVGAVTTILLSLLQGGVLLCEPLFKDKGTLIAAYLCVQVLSGIPFAFINGVDSKLSGKVFEAIGIAERDAPTQRAEIRRCKVAGTTAASAIGALAWCAVILWNHKAPKEAAWYSILFALNMVPAVLLLRYVRRLGRQLQQYEPKPPRDGEPAAGAVKENARTEVAESIVAIGCLEGLLQFSQFYFSVQAIKILFEKVPQFGLLLFAIPLMFYLVNGIEQFGASLFSRYQLRVAGAEAGAPRGESSRRRQYDSLKTLLVAAIFFIVYVVLARVFTWNSVVDVVAYGLFNVIKGFASGLSEEWNGSIAAHYPRHDEARFSTLSATFGRVYQIAAIALYFALNLLNKFGSLGAMVEIDKWKELFADMRRGPQKAGAFAGTLTVFMCVILAANFSAYFWVRRPRSRPGSLWDILRVTYLVRAERATTFAQMLRVLFVVSLILSNLLSLKYADLGGVSFAHGSIFYIMTFILINLIAVFEGAEAAIKTVFLGMLSYVVVYVALIVSAFAGHAIKPGVPVLVGEYDILLGQLSDLYLASFTAYIIAVFLNVLLFKVLSGYFGKSSAAISIAVTLISQMVDTVVFVLLGFGPKGAPDLTSLLIGQFSIKFSVYLVMYFPLYLAIRACQQWMGLEGRPADAG